MTAIEPPVYSHCVVGFREWRLADWLLAPLSVGDPWRPGVNRARCNLGTPTLFMAAADPTHDAPHGDCDCGFYAFHDLPPHPRSVYSFDRRTDMVLGAVAAWGNLEVHHDGFRAECAQILAIAEPTRYQHATPEGFALAVETYRVPVVACDELQAEAMKHGQPLPEAARPPKPKPVMTEVLVRFSSLSLPYFTVPALPASLFWKSSVVPVMPPAPPAPSKATVGWGGVPFDIAVPGDGQALEEMQKAFEKDRRGLPRPRRAPKTISPRKSR